MVYSATGKYIYPTRLRQIVKTENSTHLSAEQQAFVSKDQKHTSTVARMKYKKLRSRDVAAKAKEAFATIGKTSTLSLSPPETRYRRTTRRQPTSRQKKQMPQKSLHRKRFHFLETKTHVCSTESSIMDGVDGPKSSTTVTFTFIQNGPVKRCTNVQSSKCCANYKLLSDTFACPVYQTHTQYP